MLVSGYARIRMEVAMDYKISKTFSFSASASIASEAVNAIRTVSSLAIGTSVLGQYTQELDDAISASTKPLFLIMLPFAFTQCLVLLPSKLLCFSASQAVRRYSKISLDARC